MPAMTALPRGPQKGGVSSLLQALLGQTKRMQADTTVATSAAAAAPSPAAAVVCQWREIKQLGTGGFGAVALWKCEATGELVAIKKCRVQSEMSLKHRQRWEQEVDIMKRLSHDNVIRATEVPAGLSTHQGELCVMAMEYCSGGDLRGVLNQVQNACGLKEAQVRKLVSDVAAGVEYLHSKRIIHRDLKPENVVLQPAGEVFHYKIIDLGYAKELDGDSVCQSFVGTLQYLAPELFNNKKYTCTVDYWSFGIVVFECITGFRPFLPTLPPLQWHNHVSRKQQEDICAFFNMKGDVTFSKKLPNPNHLCRTSRTYFEQFLRLMLTWDPQARGGGFDEHKRARCFPLLGEILRTKVVHVFCVPMNHLLSYPINDSHSMHDLQATLELETHIPEAEQELLLSNGNSPVPTGLAQQLWSAREEDCIVFLFRKRANGKPGATQITTNRKTKPILEAVQYMITEPSAIMNYQDQKKAWSQAMFMCSESALDCKRLSLATKALLLSLMKQYREFNSLCTQVNNDLLKLTAMIDLSSESLKLDIELYKRQENTEGRITSNKLFSEWQKMTEDLQAMRKLQVEMGPLHEDAQRIQARIVEVQRSPHITGKPAEALEQAEKESLRLYEELKKIPREERQKKCESSQPMIAVVVRCFKNRERVMDELYSHMQKLADRSAELSALMPRVQECIRKVAYAQGEVSRMQVVRQKGVWLLLKCGLQQSAGGQAALSGGAGTPGKESSFTKPTQVNGPLSVPQMLSLLDSAKLESLNVISANDSILKSVEDFLDSQPSSGVHSADTAVAPSLELDWMFLDK